MTNITYTDAQIRFLIDKRSKDVDWTAITAEYNKFFNESKTKKSLQMAFDKYKDMIGTDGISLQKIMENRRLTKSKSNVSKENRLIIDYLQGQSDLIESLKKTVDQMKFTKPTVIKVEKSKNKKKMTQEIMLTDVHYGKKTKSVNLSVIRQRVRKAADEALKEQERYQKSYNLEKVILFFGGDMLENADFHGKESTKCSEFGTNEQIVNAIVSLYEDMLVPIISTGRQIDVIAVTGNHDRDDEKKTFHYPGLYHKTYIIYTMLEYMCKLSGVKNIKFHIPEGVYYVHEVYGDTVLYEHLDNVDGGLQRKSMLYHMAKRGGQTGKIIKFMRGGHYHELTIFGRGTVIIGPSIPGNDSYSDIKGFSSEGGIVINYYVENSERPDSYYHSFPVYLE